MQVWKKILEKKKKGKKQFAILIDPDKSGNDDVKRVAELSENAGADLFFVGSSILTNGNLFSCIETLKKNSSVPVVIFPGNTLQISHNADAILFLSLISGRNPEMLIGKHVIAAPLLKTSNLEIIPTGYMLVESGRPTAVSYMSNSTPIPADKNDIAACTALAGEMLGMKLIFMDGGSGAQIPVSKEMIAEVRKNISAPIIVGGGIKTSQKALENCKAGADIIVVGNSIEKDKTIIKKIASAIQHYHS